MIQCPQRQYPCLLQITGPTSAIQPSVIKTNGRAGHYKGRKISGHVPGRRCHRACARAKYLRQSCPAKSCHAAKAPKHVTLKQAWAYHQRPPSCSTRGKLMFCLKSPKLELREILCCCQVLSLGGLVVVLIALQGLELPTEDPGGVPLCIA